MEWATGSVCLSRNELFLFAFYLEGEILLRDIAETNHDNGREHLRDRGIDMELFYEQLDEDDIQPDTDHHQKKIPEQLYPTMQRAARKGDMPVQKEPGGEAHAKGDKDRSDPRRNGLRKPVEIDMYVGLMQDIVEAEPIHHDIDHSAGPAAGSIPESLYGHDPAKGRIKEIDKSGDIIFQLLHHIASLRSEQRYLQNASVPKHWP